MKFYLILAVVIVVIGIIGILVYKLKKGKKSRIENKILKRQKKSTIKIQRERNRLNYEKNKSSTDINNADSDKLSDAYSDKLSDLPD